MNNDATVIVYTSGHSVLLAQYCYRKGPRMKTKAAIAWKAGAPLTVEEVDLEGPKAGEVLIEVWSMTGCRWFQSTYLPAPAASTGKRPSSRSWNTFTGT